MNQALHFSFALLGLALVNVCHADIVEYGELNVIEDVNNASDGLRFLDISFSRNRTLEDALANARQRFSDARLATPSE